MLPNSRLNVGRATSAAGNRAALLIALAAVSILLPVIWVFGQSPTLLTGVVVGLVVTLIAIAVYFWSATYPVSVARAIDIQVEAPTHNVRVPLFERFFAVSVLFYSTDAFWRVLQGPRDTQSGVWTGALTTNFLWVVIYLTAFWLVKKHCIVPWHLWKRGLVLLLPVAVAAMSLLWSQDRVLTFLRCGALVGSALIALYFALRFTVPEILHFAAYALAIAAITSTIAAVFVPGFAVGKGEFQGLWLGAFAHKNELGSMMAVGFLIHMLLFWHERPHRLLRLSLAALSIFLVFKADAMASFSICCVLPYLCWISKKTLPRNVSVSRRILYFGLPVLILVAGLALAFDRILEVMGRDANLTGRTKVWAAVAPAILERLYVGYGYEAFWRGYQGTAGEIWTQLGQYHYYSHNGFMEVLLALGLVGLVSLLVALLFYSRHAFLALQRGNTIEAFWPWALLLYLALSNLLEGTVMKSNNLPWLLYMITALSFCR